MTTLLSISILQHVSSLDLELPSNVFKPSFMTNEICKALNIKPDEMENAKILDLGTGPGTIAIALHLIGCKNIYVSDKLNETIEVAKRNFAKYSFTPKGIYISDLFNSIPDDLKFDIIITNPPAYPENTKLKMNDGLDISIFSGKHGRTFIDRFFDEVKNYISTKGRFVITVPSFLDWDLINDILRNKRIRHTCTISENCILPTYGYDEYKFIDNFKNVFKTDYYIHGNSTNKHYWNNTEQDIEFKVKTINGHFLIQDEQ